MIPVLNYLTEPCSTIVYYKVVLHGNCIFNFVTVSENIFDVSTENYMYLNITHYEIRNVP